MAATYDGSLSTAKDRLRFALGDTNTGEPDFPDETYLAVLARHSENETDALAELAAALQQKLARDPVKIDRNGDITDYSDRNKAVSALARNAADAADVPGAPNRKMSHHRPYRADY